MNNFTFVQFVRILIAYSPILIAACGSAVFVVFTYFLAFKVLGKSSVSKIVIWIVLLLITFIVAALGSIIIFNYLNPKVHGPDDIECSPTDNSIVCRLVK